MAKEKQVKTNAMRILDRNKIKYSVNFYTKLLRSTDSQELLSFLIVFGLHRNPDKS